MTRLAELELEENFALAALRRIITTSTEPARITAAASAILRFCTQARREERAMQELIDSRDEDPTQSEVPDDNDFDPDEEPIDTRPTTPSVSPAAGLCSSTVRIENAQSPKLTTTPQAVPPAFAMKGRWQGSALISSPSTS